MKSTPLRRWQKSIALHGLALSLLVFAGQFLVHQAKVVADAKEVSLPLVASLPTMERRLESLTQQVEMAELESALRHGSQEEQVSVFILPEQPDFDRLIATFNVFGDALATKGVLKDMSHVEIGDPVRDGDVAMRPLHLTFAAHDDGLQAFLTFMRLAGLLTISDALTPEERDILIQRTEEENPTGIVSLEQFFATDLLRYAQDPRSYEEQVQRSFSSPTFLSAFRTVLQSPLLRDARLLLGSSLGTVLQSRDLWPFPFLVIDTIHLERGAAPKWQKVSVQMLLYTRG